jgi:hypothetical protein
MSREISPRRLGADTFLSRHSAQLFERARAIDEWSSSDDLVSCFVRFCFLPVVPFYFRDGAIRFRKLTSLTVVRFHSGNSWSYLRLVAYGFLWSSKCEVVRNVELARKGPANRGLRYFQLHIST